MTNVHINQIIKKSPIGNILLYNFSKDSNFSNISITTIRKTIPFLPKMSSFLSLIIFLLFILPFTTSFSFNFTSFNSSTPQFITFQNDSFFDKFIKLTKNELDNSIAKSVGRAIYRDPIRIYDAASGDLADFTTHFSFVIDARNSAKYGDGLTFFISSVSSTAPQNSSGSGLGLVSEETAPNGTSNFVAIEFDTFKNEWDPSENHVGIDINSVKSVATVNWNSSLKGGKTGNAWVSYNASTKNLSVFLTYDKDPIFNSQSTLFHIVDLRDVLPEMVEMGFSASTGSFVELHFIHSWDFSTTLTLVDQRKTKSGASFGLGVSLTIGLLLLVGGFVWAFLWMRRMKEGTKKEKFDDDDEEEEEDDISFDDEFKRGRGPKRFFYRELAAATKNFDEEMKLGEGGFGGVYKGVLKEYFGDVAIKRVSRGSKQGKKEYVAEVKIISRLRHRNLVQLVGWCHGRGELILVYEYLPNGSLDGYLYDSTRFLAWHLRYSNFDHFFL